MVGDLANMKKQLSAETASMHRRLKEIQHGQGIWCARAVEAEAQVQQLTEELAAHREGQATPAVDSSAEVATLASQLAGANAELAGLRTELVRVRKSKAGGSSKALTRARQELARVQASHDQDMRDGAQKLIALQREIHALQHELATAKAVRGCAGDGSEVHSVAEGAATQPAEKHVGRGDAGRGSHGRHHEDLRASHKPCVTIHDELMYH